MNLDQFGVMTIHRQIAEAEKALITELNKNLEERPNADKSRMLKTVKMAALASHDVMNDPALKLHAALKKCAYLKEVSKSKQYLMVKS